MPEEADEAAFWETPDIYGAYPRLTEDQIARLAEHGQRRSMAPNDVLIREEGERCRDVLRRPQRYGRRRRGLRHSRGTRAARARPRSLHRRTRAAARTGGLLHRCRQGPGRGPRRLLGPIAPPGVPGLHHRGPRAARLSGPSRAAGVGQGAGYRIIGSRYSPDTRRLREFAIRNRLPHRWIDLETDEEAEDLLRRFGVGPEETPLVIWRDTTLLRNPSNAELARLIGLPSLPAGNRHGDVLIVGSGPAGLAAAVYAASEGLSTTVVEAMATGGQAATSSRIENLLGFPTASQAPNSPNAPCSKPTSSAPGSAFRWRRPVSIPRTRTTTWWRSPTAARSPPAPSSWPRAPATAGSRCPAFERLEGTSVHYSATVYEAQQCRTDPVAVVGGGNSAGQAVLFLAGYAPKVHLLVRGPSLEANMSRYLVDQVERHPRVEVMLHTEVTEVIGQEVLEELDVVENNRAGTADSRYGACSSSPARTPTPSGSPASVPPSTPAASSSAGRRPRKPAPTPRCGTAAGARA